MPGEMFEKIINTEKQAKNMVLKAEENSKRIIDKEKERIEKERKVFYNKLEQKKAEKLREMNNQIQLLREENETEILRKTKAAAEKYENMKNAAIKKVLEIMVK